MTKKKKNKDVDYDLKDFTWEVEDFDFEPKVNRHKAQIKGKQKQMNKALKTAERERKDRGFFRKQRAKLISAAEEVINGNTSEEDYDELLN